MAQGIILAAAAGSTAAQSTAVTLTTGATGTIALFVAAGTVPLDAIYDVVLVTSGTDLPIARLGGGVNVVQVAGPGVYKVNRITSGVAGVAVGVCADPNV